MSNNALKVKELLSITKNLKLLYVEDNKEAREQTLKMLKNFFKDIDIAIDGEDGLQKYQKYHDENSAYYDLIITDINMPKMDGLTLSKAIKEIKHNQHIIVISAYNDSKNLQKCIDVGIKNYLHKPIDLTSLIDVLTKATDSIKVQKDSDTHLNIVERSNNELDALVNSFDKYVIASRTDLDGKITYVSKAYEKISGYSKAELVGELHSIVRHPDMPSSTFRDLWESIQNKKTWHGKIKNLKKDGSHYWADVTISPYYDADNNHVGYSAIRIDITSQKRVEELNKQVSDLLNSAGQGFLSFDKELKCEAGYSKECLSIFCVDDIEGMDISTLLFNQKPSNQALFDKAMTNILDADDDMMKELFLSLLPKEQEIEGKTIQIEYKLLQNSRFMTVLTDITDKKELQKQLESQDQIQKMIVAVASNRDDFLELKSEFEDFISNPPSSEVEMIRTLHTFKGNFSQKQMLYIVDGIHEFESLLKEDVEVNTNSFKELLSIFNKDIKIITSNLQEKFLVDDELLRIQNKPLQDIEDKIKALAVLDDGLSDDIEEILFDISRLRYKSVKDMLSHYPKQVQLTAKKLDKYIYPVDIKGDEKIVAPSRIKPLIKSLVHLFNNCVGHGIESTEQRSLLGKDEMGRISCYIEQVNNILILEISDDGAGIDIDKLTKSVIEKGFKSEAQCFLMSNEEKYELIFLDDITTHENATLTSGRGVGMSALKYELDKIEAKLFIQSEKDKGSTFKFLIPLEEKRLIKKQLQDEDVMLDALINQAAKLIEDSTGAEIYGTNYIFDIDKSDINEHCTKIDFTNGYDGCCILSCNSQMKDALRGAFIPEGYSKQETDEMLEELSSEVANIIMGVSIVDFPEHLGVVSISVPQTICNSDGVSFIENAKEKHIKEITTSHGKLLCILIENEKQKQDDKVLEEVKELDLV